MASETNSNRTDNTSPMRYPPLVGTDENDSQVFPVGFHEAHQKGIWHRAVHIQIVSGDKYVVCRRRDGRWEIGPGCGHVDWLENENRPEENHAAACREICEELALVKNWGMSFAEAIQSIQPHLSSKGTTSNRLPSSHGKNREHVEIFQLDWQDSWPDPMSYTLSKEGQYDLKWMSLDQIKRVALDDPKNINSALRLFLQRHGIHVPFGHCTHQEDHQAEHQQTSMPMPPEQHTLLVFDIDGTLTDGTRPPDVEVLAKLLQAGMHIAFITGNTSEKICESFLAQFIWHVASKRIQLLERVFVLFQMGGVLARFDDYDFKCLDGKGSDEIRDKLLPKVDGTRTILSTLFDEEYIRLCSINLESYENSLQRLWNGIAQHYQQLLQEEGHQYRLDEIEHYEQPQHQPRWIRLPSGRRYSVQYTIRGIPSEHHALTDVAPDDSIRGRVLQMVTETLRRERIPLVAKTGGKTSIDFLLPDQSKSKALRFVMGRLHISPDSVLFFGDELFRGGNDYSIPSDMGITCFSARCDSHVEYHPRILATEKSGPVGVAIVLHELAAHAERVDQFSTSVAESFKRRFLLDRIRRKFSSERAHQLPSAVLQDLLSIITIAFRDAEKDLLTNQLNLLSQLFSLHQQDQPPMGAISHDDK